MSTGERPVQRPVKPAGSRRSDPSRVQPLQGAELDTLLDAYFDRTLTEGAQDRLLDALKHDPKRSETMARTQRMIDQLRQPVLHDVDLADSVLNRVSHRKPFLSSQWRRFVRSGRAASLAACLVGLLGVAMLWRSWPEARLAPTPAPVAKVVDSSQAMANRMGQLAETMHGMSAVKEPAAGPKSAPRGQFTPLPRSQQRYVVVPMNIDGAGSRTVTRQDPMPMTMAATPHGGSGGLVIDQQPSPVEWIAGWMAMFASETRPDEPVADQGYGRVVLKIAPSPAPAPLQAAEKEQDKGAIAPPSRR